MSQYEMSQAGLIDVVGSSPPQRVSEKAKTLGPLDPDERQPDTTLVTIEGGVDHVDRLSYALRLALSLKGDRPVRYWTERDIFAQKARLDDRRQMSIRSGSEEQFGEYEVNRMNISEYEESTNLVIDGLGSSTGKYRFGQIETVTDLLAKRANFTDCVTIVVFVLSSIPDYYEYAHFREVVRPQYETFLL